MTMAAMNPFKPVKECDVTPGTEEPLDFDDDNLRGENENNCESRFVECK